MRHASLFRGIVTVLVLVAVLWAAATLHPLPLAILVPLCFVVVLLRRTPFRWSWACPEERRVALLARLAPRAPPAA